MKGSLPKKNLTLNGLKHPMRYGNEVKKGYAYDILENSPIVPLPLEYEDVDKAVKEFVEDALGLVVNGKDVPTFTLYSNQRFSEYSQSWKYTDKDGNLYLNFKTINRTNDSSKGSDQGGYWNIPGDRKYKLVSRTVLDDNGTECYEVYTMKQPYCVDLTYRISFVTDLFANLNTFNSLLNDVFKARQYYIRPNNRWVPLILDNVSDESRYSVGDYRFFVQTAEIKAHAYITHNDDIEVRRFPKRTHLFIEGEKRNYAKVNIEDIETADMTEQSVSLSINFEKNDSKKVTFVIDTDFKVTSHDLSNIRSMRMWVNKMPIFWEKGFMVENGDEIMIKINVIDYNEKSSIRFYGVNPSYTFDASITPENVSDEPIKHQSIVVE